MPRAIPFRLLAATATVLAGAPARAEMSKTFTVAATIANGCLVSTSGSGSSWGSIDLGSVTGVSAQTASGNLLSSGNAGIQMDCTPGTTANLTADQGLNAGSGTRRLVNASSATSFVPYALYVNGSATAWTTQSVPFAFPVGTSHQALPVRAVATLSGPTRGGTYSDTVRVTVSW